MAIVTARGTVAYTSGSTSNIAPTVTWSDAGSRAPQLLLVRYRSGTSGSVNTDKLDASWGMTDGTTQFGYGCMADDNATSANSAHRAVNTGVLVEVDQDGNETGLMSFSSFGTDTFTLTISNAFGTSGVIEYYCVAGLDNVAVKIYQEATATGNYDRTGAGFDPTSAFLLYAGRNTINAGGALINCGFGMAAGANQAGFAMRYRDAVTTDYIWNRISTSSVMARLDSTATTPAEESAFVSFITDGIRLNKTIGAAANYFAVALMRGGAPQVVTTAAQTSVTTWAVTTTGTTPAGGILFAAPPATATETNGREGINFSIGDFAGSAQGALAIVSANRETLAGGQRSEEYSLNRTDACVLSYDRTGANTLSVVGLVSKSSSTGGSVTLSQDDADTSAILIAMLVLGDVDSGGGTTERHTTARGLARGLSRGIAA